MIQTEDITLGKDDELTIYVIGYRKLGESIIISIGNKFLGVIDSFKVNGAFKTIDIVATMGIPIDFICWTHGDWDHTYGLAELRKFFYEGTHVIVPTGFQAREFREYLDGYENKEEYHYLEYSNLIKILDGTNNENYHEVNSDSLLYSFHLLKEGTTEKYSFTMSAFSPDSKKLREVNCEHIQRIFQNDGDDWFKTINLDNNIFSVGLRVQVQRECLDTDEKHVIKLCFAGDLVDEVIEVMGERKRMDNFQYNTFLKIPHHGSEKSKKIFELAGRNMQFEYAACTSFASKGLPADVMLDRYRKYGTIHKTNLGEDKDYGVVKYSIPIFDRDKRIRVECEGNAGEY